MVQSVMPSLTGPFILGGAGAEREGSDGGGSRGGGRSSGSIRPMTNEECGIREVWAHNMEEEFHHIRRVVQQFPYVAMEYDFCEAVDSAVGIYNKMSVVTWRETGNHVRVTKKDDDLDLPLGQASSEATLSAALQIGDTEFPGVVARPIGEFRSNADYQYQLLRCNVDLLKIIQLGLTFLDEQGKTPPGYSTWQFNFKFNLTEDMYAQDSIDLLQNSGLQFKKHEEDGIEPVDFAELLMTSGIVLVDNVKMLSFHSGYDFGYLLKLLTDQNLPAEESDFFELLRIYFPSIYDVKYLMKSCKNLKGGLQEVAEQLELERVGPQHQAGSDSLLTGAAFFKMKEMFFEDKIDDAKYCGHLYGLGTSFVVNGNSASAYNDNGHTSDSTSNS